MKLQFLCLAALIPMAVCATPVVTGVANAASFAPAIAPGCWIAIAGSDLSQTTRIWAAADIVNGQLPTSLDNVSVTVDGKPAFIYYISSTLIDALAPDSANSGNVAVIVTNNDGVSQPATAQLAPVSPALFLWPGQHVVAQHLDFSDVGPPGLFSSVTTTPAQPGETIALYGTGFGSTYPPVPVGEVVPGATPLPGPMRAIVGNSQASVTFAGLVAGTAGLYQINLVVPGNAPDGDLPISVSYDGVSSQDGVLLTVAH